eukprot:3444906-Rhodomonas_salina.5
MAARGSEAYNGGHARATHPARAPYTQGCVCKFAGTSRTAYPVTCRGHVMRGPRARYSGGARTLSRSHLSTKYHPTAHEPIRQNLGAAHPTSGPDLSTEDTTRNQIYENICVQLVPGTSCTQTVFLCT